MQKQRLTCKDCKKCRHCMESGRMERCQDFRLRWTSRKKRRREKRDSPTTIECVLIAVLLNGFFWLGILL